MKRRPDLYMYLADNRISFSGKVKQTLGTPYAKLLVAGNNDLGKHDLAVQASDDLNDLKLNNEFVHSPRIARTIRELLDTRYSHFFVVGTYHEEQRVIVFDHDTIQRGRADGRARPHK